MLLSDVCLSRTSGLSREQRPRKTKIGWHRGSPRYTWLGHHLQGQKVKCQGHQAALLSAALIGKAAAAVSVGTYSAWESTATLCLLGGTRGACVPTGGGEGRGHIVSPRAQLVDLDFCAKIRTFVFVFLDGINNYSVLLCYCSVCFTFKKIKFPFFYARFFIASGSTASCVYFAFRIVLLLRVLNFHCCIFMSCSLIRQLQILNFRVLHFQRPTGPKMTILRWLCLAKSMQEGQCWPATTLWYSKFEVLLKMLHKDITLCSSSLKFIRQFVSELWTV